MLLLVVARSVVVLIAMFCALSSGTECKGKSGREGYVGIYGNAGSGAVEVGSCSGNAVSPIIACSLLLENTV